MTAQNHQLFNEKNVENSIETCEPGADYDDYDNYCDGNDNSLECISNKGAIVELAPNTEQDIQVSYGNVSVINSNDVHFGNKTFYQGPVTIKQFLLNGNGSVLETPILDKICDSDLSHVLQLQSASKQIDGDVKSTNNEKSSGAYRRFKEFTKKKSIYLVALLFFLVLSLIIIIPSVWYHKTNSQQGWYNLRPDGNEQDFNGPIDAPLDPDVNLTLPEKLRLSSRLEWVAQPAVQPLNPLPLPAPYVIIHHTQSNNCSSQAQCRLHVRNIQNFDIESAQKLDISYNFLVGGDGEAYEGRGWKFEGAHTFNYNTRSIGIAFIGTFNKIRPPQLQIVACKKLILMGIELGFVRKNYKLYAARQLDKGTQSPGNALFDEIKTWDHWTGTV